MRRARRTFRSTVNSLRATQASTLENAAMIESLTSASDAILAFKMSGKLNDADYKQFTPKIEAAIKANGKVRVLAQFHDFHGWDLHALWDDSKFAAKHCADIERIAMVGEKTWQKWMAMFCKPFTLSTIRYFDAAKIEDVCYKCRRNHREEIADLRSRDVS